MQLACAVVFNEVGHRGHPGGNLVAQHVAHHGGAAPVGGGHQIEVVLLADQFDQKLRCGGRCRNAHPALALARAFDPGHVIGHVLGRCAARDGKRIHKRGESGHGHKVGGRVVAGVLHHQRQDGDGVVVAQEQRGAVCGGGLEGLGGNLATGSGLVLDHDRLAQLVFQALAQDAGNGIGAAAGRKAHQQFDGFAAGLGVCAREARTQAGDRQTGRRQCREGQRPPRQAPAACVGVNAGIDDSPTFCKLAHVNPSDGKKKNDTRAERAGSGCRSVLYMQPAPVLHGFGQVADLYRVASRQVGNGAGHFHGAVGAAG